MSCPSSNESKNEQQEQEARLKARMLNVDNKILVMSGKGGVGKTTVAVNLARSLAEDGYRVGILDTDIHGPNVAKMLGAEEYRFEGTDAGIEPPQVAKNLWAASLVFSGQDADAPVIWRGPLKMGVIKQFLSDVNWGKLDYLVIDSPPGTGDEPLSVCQLLPDLSGAVIVTTPQEVAILDSRKSINFARQVNVPILGVVENMSGFVCSECKTVHNLFGKGGGEKAAKDMGVDFLGAIPMEQAIMEGEDKGISLLADHADSPAVVAIKSICNKIVDKVKASSNLVEEQHD
ncbi:MAG: Mrp/NBP35 family ATP-binding protein [Spirochaetales bacterium]|nr:Mrp/NBP35 family ATP-binding protein [Spirochaetales bacterium]